jgi:hypothetical protein
MSDTRALDTIRRWERLRSQRATIETLWQEIAELVWPDRADFTVRRQEGERRGQRQFDSGPQTALEQLSSGLWGAVTNSATDWFHVRHPDPEVSSDSDVHPWLEACRASMRDAFSANGSAFYAQVQEVYKDLGAFGTACLYVGEREAQGRLVFRAHSVSTFCIDVDDWGQVDTVVRRFRFTARQAHQRWGDAAGERVLRALDRDPMREFEFLHIVEPNPDADARRDGWRWMPFRSLHVSCEGKDVVQEGGFRVLPYCVPRWSTAQGGLYGQSPAMQALADIKVLNQLERLKLVAGQKMADPTLLTADEGTLRSVRAVPGGIIYGGVDADGRPRVVPLVTGADLRVYEAMAEQKRNAIREAFHNTLMLMQPRANATATEILERREEQLRLLGPQLSRIETELLDPLTRVVFDMLLDLGAFPQVPEVLLADGRVKIEYVSPLTTAQRSGAAANVMRAMQAVVPLSQSMPGILDNFDADEVGRGIARGYDLPAAMLRDAREVAEQRAQQAAAAAEAQQAAEAAAAMKPMADGARAMREMQQMAEGGA